MREVNVRRLRERLAVELRDLPFLITRNGVIIAVCLEYVRGEGEDEGS